MRREGSNFLQPKKPRFSVGYVLVPVCVVVAGAYLIWAGPELWKSDPAHLDHETQQFNTLHEHAAAEAGYAIDSKRDAQFKRAFRAYQAALQVRPDNSQVHNDLGALYMEAARAQMLPLVEEDLTKYAEDYGHSPVPTLDYIEERLRKTLSTESAQFLWDVRKDAAQLLSEKVDGWNQSGTSTLLYADPVEMKDGVTIYSVFIVYGKAARYLDSAENRFRRAIELRPDYAAAYRNLGALYMLTHRPGEAKLTLQQALRFDPKDIELIRYLNQLDYM